MYQPDAPVTERVHPTRHFKLNVASTKHGPVTFIGFVSDVLFDPSFAFGTSLSGNLQSTLPRFHPAF